MHHVILAQMWTAPYAVGHAALVHVGALDPSAAAVESREGDHDDEQEGQRRHLEPVCRAAASGLDTEQERLIWGDFVVRHIFVSFDAQKRKGPIQ